MNLEELQTVRDTERSKDSLQSLRDSFYEDVGEYLSRVRSERARAAEASGDAFADPEVRRLTDEVETAERTVEAIYERRVGKMVKLASFAAADIPIDDEGLTTEERALFETVVEEIETNRRRVLDVLGDSETATGVEPGAASADPTTTDRAGREETPPPGSSTTAGAEPSTDGPNASGDGPESEPAEGDTKGDELESTADGRASAGDGRESADDAGEEARADRADAETGVEGQVESDRLTVRITRDVGEILGVDERAYDLSTDDVVTLPVANAKPLCRRDAAEPLE